MARLIVTAIAVIIANLILGSISLSLGLIAALILIVGLALVQDFITRRQKVPLDYVIILSFSKPLYQPVFGLCKYGIGGLAKTLLGKRSSQRRS